MKEYPGTTIPGIEYDRKTTEKRPEVFKFTGTKTPPGRNRVNNPRAAIRHPEENPSHHPRQRLELGNATLRGANTEPLGIRPKPIPPKDDANGANSIQQIFRGNFIDLDQIDTGSVVITAPTHPKSKVDSQNTRVLDFSNGNSAPTLPVLAARQEGDCFAELDPLNQQSKKTFYTKGHGSLINIPAAAGSSSAMTKLMEAANRSQSEENLSKSRGQKRSNHRLIVFRVTLKVDEQWINLTALKVKEDPTAHIGEDGTVTLASGIRELQLEFNTVSNVQSIRLDVTKTDASNNNVVLNEIIPKFEYRE